MAPPSFESMDWPANAEYVAWRKRLETTTDDDDVELKLRVRWYRRTHDAAFAGPPVQRRPSAPASAGRPAPASAAASAAAATAAPPRPRPGAAAATGDSENAITARATSRYLALAFAPLALALTPPAARLLAAAARSPAAALWADHLGSSAYAAALAFSFCAQVLAIRDKHGAPPLRGVRAPGGLAALRDWAARAAGAGAAADGALAAWALLFFANRGSARVGAALAPLAVAAAVQSDDGGGASAGGGWGAEGSAPGARFGRYASLPPRKVRAWLRDRSAWRPDDAAAWSQVAVAFFLAFVRLPLALAAGPAGSARATALLAYYVWSLLRARKSGADGEAAAMRAAWRRVGGWARPRVERAGGAGAARALAFLRERWWDAPGMGGGGGGGGAR